MKAGLLALLLAVPAGAAKIQVHGHRGCRALRPENTMAAFRHALALGVDVLELDLQVTKDGVLVVTHDAVPNPDICLCPYSRSGPCPAIRAMPLSEVRRLDCGTVKNPRFPRQVPSPGERIPTLDEVFALAEGTTIEFNIEPKMVPDEPELSPEPEEFARLVVAAVKKRGLEKRVIVQSFDDRVFRAVRESSPDIRLALLTSDNHFDYVAAAKSARAAILSPDKGWITAEDVAALHKAGVQVAPWTVNDPKGWARMAAMGVDAIITDDPDALIAYLKGRGLR